MTMPKRRRLVVGTAGFDVAYSAANPNAMVSLEALKAILGHRLDGYCFVSTSVPMTNRPSTVVGWAPFVYIDDHRCGLVTGTWFDPSLRRTGAHKPSIIGRLLHLFIEGFRPEHILACPGLVDPRIECRMPAFGFRPVTWDEFHSLPKEAQQVGQISAKGCKKSPTGIYCLDTGQLQRLVAEYEAYLRTTEAGLWLNEHYHLDVDLEHDHYLAADWPRVRDLCTSQQQPLTW